MRSGIALSLLVLLVVGSIVVTLLAAFVLVEVVAAHARAAAAAAERALEQAESHFQAELRSADTGLVGLLRAAWADALTD